VPASSRYNRALREQSPRDTAVAAIEIAHPDLPSPARAVADGRDHTIEGHRYPALPFTARLVDDVEGRAPSAELSIDNVGRELTQWIEAAGGRGTARVMMVLATDDGGESPVEWEVTLDVLHVRVDRRQVVARLGYDPLLGRPAVLLRHDPERSPGLF